MISHALVVRPLPWHPHECRDGARWAFAASGCRAGGEGEKEKPTVGGILGTAVG